MRKLRDITTRLSLAELVEAAEAQIRDGKTSPEVRPEGEKEFVKLHKTQVNQERYGNKKSSDATKKDTSKAGKEPLPGFPPEVKEEEEKSDFEKMTTLRRRSDRSKTPGTKGYKERQAAARRRSEISKKHPELSEETEIDEARFSKKPTSKLRRSYPIVEPKKRELAGVKTDPKGNVILSKKQQRDVEHLPRSRKLSGRPFKPVQEQEDLDEGNYDPIHTSGRRSKTRQARAKAGPNFPTVLVSPKGEKGGGKVSGIPKSQYDPKKHSLAEEQLNEKNWIQDAIKKPGALTAAAHRAKKSVGAFAQAHKHSSGKVGKRARLALTLKKLHKEETEPLDELKGETLRNYTKVAAASAVGAAGNKDYKKAGKRLAGINKAQERLGGTFETGKPLRVMIPGKTDKDPATGPYTMKRKKLYHGEETEQLDEGGPTKKHFQMAADAIRAIPDENKRKEHASSHADLYSKQNSRFDRGKFLKACNVKEETIVNEEDKKRLPLEYRRKAAEDIKQNQRQIRGKWPPASFQSTRDKIAKARYAQINKEETQLDEVITKSTPVGDVIHDFVHSDNPKFEGKSKKERIRMALGAAYAKKRGK